MNTRALGRSFAIVVAVCVAALIGVAWVLSPNKPGHSRPTRDDGPAATPAAPPPPSGSGVLDPLDIGGNPEQLIQEGGRGQWTGRVSADGAFYRLTYEHLEPRDEGVIELSSVEVWLPGDDRSIVIRAAEARMRRPRGEREPTDGRVSGGIIADILRGRVEDESGARAATRLARVTLDSMEFQRDRLLLQTEDNIRIEGDGIEALLHGLSASLSEDKAPLRLLRVPRGGYAHLTPELFADNASGAGESPGEGGPGAGAPRDAEQAFYELLLNGGVGVEARGAAASAGSVRVLAALTGGRLPDDAIADFAPAVAPPPASDRGDGAPGQNARTNKPERYDLTWDGPLELRPLPDAPAPLRDNALHVELRSGDDRDPARVEAPGWAGSGVEASAESIAYAATRRRLSLHGGGSPEGVRIVLPDTGEFVGSSLEMDLTTGVGSAAGPHIVRALGRASGATDPRAIGPESADLISTGRADFHIDTRHGPVGSGAPIYPRSLIFTDGVEVRRGGALLSGGTLRASFTDAGHPVPGSLAGVSVLDRARAQDDRGTWIESDAIDVLFAPDPRRDNRPAPFSARASSREGRLGAGTPEVTLAAGHLEAAIAPDERGRPEIGDFTIRDDVSIRFVDGTSARADVISGDARARTAQLRGAPAEIGRADGTGSASLEADAFALDGAARTLKAAGPGKGRAVSSGPGGAREVDFHWTRSLFYDDTRGRAEVAGGVELRAQEHLVTPGGAQGLRTHHATGDRVTLDLTRQGQDDSARNLTRAMLQGAQSEEDWARVETRVYALDETGARRLLGVLFVSGPLLDAQPDAQRVAVAGPGRLLVDNRADASRAQDAGLLGASPDALASSRGTSLFEWKERLDLDARAGSAQMRGEVTFRHVNPSTGEVTDLRADELGAGFALESGSERAELREVTAVGSVVARHGSLQIVADAARYDARAGEIVARGEGGRRVTILDNSTGRQDEAGAIRLSLETGAWSVTDPGSVLIHIP